MKRGKGEVFIRNVEPRAGTKLYTKEELEQREQNAREALAIHQSLRRFIEENRLVVARKVRSVLYGSERLLRGTQLKNGEVVTLCRDERGKLLAVVYQEKQGKATFATLECADDPDYALRRLGQGSGCGKEDPKTN